MLTRAVDILIRRADFAKVTAVAESQGFKFRHVAGVDMLLFGGNALNPIHLLFAEEKVKPSQAIPNPPLAPERGIVHGVEVFVMPVADLVRMKLSAHRLKDRVHIQSLDAAGLITAEIERQLPEPLRARLRRVRETE